MAVVNSAVVVNNPGIHVQNLKTNLPKNSRYPLVITNMKVLNPNLL